MTPPGSCGSSPIRRFPTGGFAHSFGLEAAWQQGEVNAGSLARFVRDAIVQAGRGGVPFVSAAHDDPRELAAIDAQMRRLPAQSGRQSRQPRPGPRLDRRRSNVRSRAPRSRVLRRRAGAADGPALRAAVWRHAQARSTSIDSRPRACTCSASAAAHSRPPSAWALSAPPTPSGCSPNAPTISIARWRHRCS